MQSRKAVTAYLKSKQLLPFDIARQGTFDHSAIMWWSCLVLQWLPTHADHPWQPRAEPAQRRRAPGGGAICGGAGGGGGDSHGDGHGDGGDGDAPRAASPEPPADGREHEHEYEPVWRAT